MFGEGGEWRQGHDEAGVWDILGTETWLHCECRLVKTEAHGKVAEQGCLLPPDHQSPQAGKRELTLTGYLTMEPAAARVCCTNKPTTNTLKMESCLCL